MAVLSPSGAGGGLAVFGWLSRLVERVELNRPMNLVKIWVDESGLQAFLIEHPQ